MVCFYSGCTPEHCVFWHGTIMCSGQKKLENLWAYAMPWESILPLLHESHVLVMWYCDIQNSGTACPHATCTQQSWSWSGGNTALNKTQAALRWLEMSRKRRLHGNEIERVYDHGWSEHDYFFNTDNTVIDQSTSGVLHFIFTQVCGLEM